MNQPRKPRRSGFDNVHCFLAFYDAACMKRLSPERSKLNKEQKLELTRFFFRFRGTWGIPVEEIRHVIQFAYMHNPLGVDLRAYGTRELLNDVMPHYRRWKHQQASLIKAVGIAKAITQSIDFRTDTDRLLEELMDGLLSGEND